MELERLRVFLAAAEEGGFTPAARRLYISHSTVSRHMAALEEELGARLFERGSGGVTLTAAGRLLREKAPELLRAAESLAEEIKKAGDNL